MLAATLPLILRRLAHNKEKQICHCCSFSRPLKGSCVLSVEALEGSQACSPHFLFNDLSDGPFVVVV